MAAKKKTSNPSEYHGAVLVDKPAGMTSHDVVDRVRRIFGLRRVGHTGTLDPQATGLLVLLLGEATKISEYLVGVDKSYEGTMRYGVTSDTYDLEGEIVPTPGAKIPTRLDKVQEVASDFTGTLKQVPPPYSAKKVGGKKLYEYAREGDVPVVEPRNIRVDDFEVLNLENGQSEFGIDCSSGTYVRSLVHDLGQRIGCGAILVELRRTDVGSFGIEDAKTLEQLEEIATEGKLPDHILPIRKALAQFPTLYLLPSAEGWLRRGQCIPHSLLHSEENLRPTRGANVLLCRANGEAVAIARVDPAPISPAPKALSSGSPPWYQPLKQFEIDAPKAAPEEE